MLRQAREFLSQPTIFGANAKNKTTTVGKGQADEQDSLTSGKLAAKGAPQVNIIAKEKKKSKDKKSLKKEKVKEERTKKTSSGEGAGGDNKTTTASNLKASKQSENFGTSNQSIVRDDSTTKADQQQQQMKQVHRRRQNPSSSSGGSSSGYLSQTNGFVRTATASAANNDEISANNISNNETQLNANDVSSLYMMQNGARTAAIQQQLQQQQQRLERTSIDNRQRAADPFSGYQSGAMPSMLSKSIETARLLGQQHQLRRRNQHEQMMRAPMMVPMMIDDDDDDDDDDGGADVVAESYDEESGQVLAQSHHNFKHDDDEGEDEDDEYGLNPYHSDHHLERRSLNYRLGQHLIDGVQRDHDDKLSLMSSRADHRRFQHHHRHHHHQQQQGHNYHYHWREPEHSLSLAQSRSMMAMSLADSGGHIDCAAIDSDSGADAGGGINNKADDNEELEPGQENDDGDQLHHSVNLMRRANEDQFLQQQQPNHYNLHHSYNHRLHKPNQAQSRPGQVSGAFASTINGQQRHLTASAAGTAAIYYQPDLISELQLQQHRNQRPKYQVQTSSTFLYRQHQPQYAYRKQHFLSGQNRPVPPLPPQANHFDTFTDNDYIANHQLVNNSDSNNNNQLNQRPTFAPTNAILNYSKSVNQHQLQQHHQHHQQQQQRQQSSRSRLATNNSNNNNNISMITMMQTSSSRQQLTSPDSHQHQLHAHNQSTPHHSSSASSSPHIRRNNKNVNHQNLAGGSQIISATKQNLRPVPSRSTPTPTRGAGDQTGSISLAETSSGSNNGHHNSNNRSVGVSCCGKMAKFLLFIANALFWASGIALGAWGIITLVDDHKYNLSQLLVFEPASRMSLFQLLSWSFITLGCATILVGFCGCSALFKNSRWILGLYIFLILAIFALDLATGLLAIIFQERLVANVRLRLVNKLRNDYGIQASFTAAIDYIQTRFECCGMDGHFDYDQSLWRLQRLGGFEATVARTCCHLRNTFDDQAHVNPRPVNETMCQSTDVRFHQSYRYRRGCLDDLERLIRQKIWTFTLGCAAVGGIILLSLIFATCFCRSIPNSGSRKSPVSTASGSRTYHKQQQQQQQQHQPQTPQHKVYSAAGKRSSSKKNKKQLGHLTSTNYR